MEERSTRRGAGLARRARPMRVAAVAMAVAVAGGSLGACSSGGGDGEAAADEPSSTTTTAAPDGPASTPVPTTSGPSTSIRRGATSLPLIVPHSDDGTSPDGDGCDLAEGAPLPNGLWFGTIVVEGEGLALDVACLYTGAAADAAAATDPAAQVPTPNGYYVSDQGTATYPLAVNAETLTLALDGTSTSFEAPAPGIDAARTAVAGSPTPFRAWVFVLDDVVTVVQQQYLP